MFAKFRAQFLIIGISKGVHHLRKAAHGEFRNLDFVYLKKKKKKLFQTLLIR